MISLPCPGWGDHWLALSLFHLVSILTCQLLGEGCVKGTAVVLLALSATNAFKVALEVERMANSSM